ncbi:MAG TPA: transporter substrate-binding domain-containing protein [Anaeromyxobacteraceae bacterium]|nr:transporter substrate-binding domain-containing protein [Anaeromyxobacteraceae bacterium]
MTAGFTRTAIAALALVAAGSAARAQPMPEIAGPPHVIVGADPDYPPYEFVDRDGKPAGYNVDLTRAIADVMGMTVEFRFGKWARMREALRSGEVDVLQGISWSEERAKDLDFAAPHAIVHHAIFARRGAPAVTSLDDLRGKRVIVFGGGIMDEQLTRRGFGQDLVRTGTPADAMRRLAAGQGEYVALALLPGVYIARDLGLTNVEPVARRVAAESYGYAVRKGEGELLARFDEGLAILKATGRYDEIHRRWLGVLQPQGVGPATIARYAAAVLVPLLLVLAATVIWSRSLRRVVAQRTESLRQEVAERERAVAALRLHQQQLVQADKLAALGVLVAGVAHEINNPTGLILLDVPIVKGALEDALAALDAQPDRAPATLAGLPYARMRQEIPKLLEEMAGSGRRIKRIVDDLKAFARREDAPALEAVDLNAVAETAARLVGNSLRKATHRFEQALAPGLPRVRANAQRIEQVVVNLLLNACEALPSPDRAVRLSTRHDPAAGLVVIEVRDEGVGIPEEHLSRVTDPFFTTKRASGGTGLGLSVSAGIVREHGGTLTLTSGVGAGTVATLSLPAVQEASA